MEEGIETRTVNVENELQKLVDKIVKSDELVRNEDQWLLSVGNPYWACFVACHCPDVTMFEGVFLRGVIG